MARRKTIYTVQATGRDKGKVFHLEELPPRQSEGWAMRLLLILIRANPTIPEGTEMQGMAALNRLVGTAAIDPMAFLRGFSGAMIDHREIAVLMDEMLLSLKAIQPDPHRPEITRPVMLDNDIDEIATLFELRKAIVQLHMGFFEGGEA